jgi:adenylate kinase family enzyme
MNASLPLIIDGEWFDLPEEEVVTQYTDLLSEARRSPEIVIYFTVSEEKMLERLLDRNTIETKYQELVDKRNEDKRIKRLEDREAKLKELHEDEEKTPEMIEEEMAEWDKNRDQEEAEDDDPEAPNLNTMLDESKEKLIESRNTQSEFCDDFVEKIKEK